MLKNFILERQIEEVYAKRKPIGERQHELEKLISALGISYNQVQARSKHIPEEKWKLRDAYVAELFDLKAQIAPLNDQLKNLYRERESDRNLVLVNIFKEMFSPEQYDMIKKEASRRVKGEPAIRVNLDWKNLEDYKEKSTRYKKLYKEQVEAMIEFRILLTGLIEKGCEQFGNAQFLKFISPLNNLITPVNELRRIKVTHLL